MSLKVGFFSSPYLHLDDDGKVTGVAPSVYKESFYFAIDKFNVTFQELDSKLARCLGNECSYSVGILRNVVDYITGLLSLPQLFPNITVGPPLINIQCFLATAPKTKILIRNQTIMTAFNHIDRSTIWIFFTLFMVLIALHKLRSSINFTRALWSSLEILFHGSTISMNVSDRLCLLYLLVLYGFISVFFSSSVQTSVIKKESSTKVNTFDDILTSNFSIGFIAYDCESLMRLIPNNHMRDKIMSKSEPLYDDPNTPRIFRKFRSLRSKYCFVTKKAELEMLLYLGCSAPRDGTLTRNEIYFSNRPVLSGLGLNFLSKKTSLEIRNTLVRIAYNAFEMRLNSEPVSPKLARAVVGITNVKCANEILTVDRADYSPLNSNFFSTVFHLFLSILLISLLFFWSELQAKRLADSTRN